MKQTQVQIILEELLAGRKLTPMRAMRLCGSMRLSARIGDIELLGYEVGRRMKPYKTKRGLVHVAEYYI